MSEVPNLAPETRALQEDIAKSEPEKSQAALSPERIAELERQIDDLKAEIEKNLRRLNEALSRR